MLAESTIKNMIEEYKKLNQQSALISDILQENLFIDDLIKLGLTVQAIKKYRNACGCTLSQANDVIKARKEVLLCV